MSNYGWENGKRVPISPEREIERPQAERGAAVMLRRLVGILLADPDPALGVECLALVTGIGYTGGSMESVAKRHKVTRAAVSKRCVELCETFGLPPVRAMRPKKNRENCRRARLQSLAKG